MQLFELVSPKLFRPLAGPNRAYYAELLLLLWEECSHTADYSLSRAEAVSRAEDYFAAVAKPLALDADGAVSYTHLDVYKRQSVLIPIQCEYYALEGLSELISTLKTIRKKYNPYLDIEGLSLIHI